MRLRVGVKSSQNPSWAFIAKSTQLLLLWDDSLFVTLIVPGTMCAWIPSHDKQKEWRPPEGWPDVNHCRALNKRADAAAGSVSASFQEEISAALMQHHSAASWAAAAFKAQKENRQLFGKCFSTMALLVVAMVSESLWLAIMASQLAYSRRFATATARTASLFSHLRDRS